MKQLLLLLLTVAGLTSCSNPSTIDYLDMPTRNAYFTSTTQDTAYIGKDTYVRNPGHSTYVRVLKTKE